MAGWNKLTPAPNLGMPYHGLVTDGVLALPNGGSIDLGDPLSGPSYELRSPTAPGITRSTEQAAADTAAGREWREYALTNSGARLNGHPIDGSIYIDAAGTPWLIDVIALADDRAGYLKYTITVTLKKLFGRFGRAWPAINRQLHSDTYSARSAISPYFSGASYAKILTLTHDTRGATWKAGGYLMSGSYNRTERGFVAIQNPYFSNGTFRSGILDSIFTIEITGNGSTDPNTLGDGISCSVSQEVVDQQYSTSTTPITVSVHGSTYDATDVCIENGTLDTAKNDYYYNFVIAEYMDGDTVNRVTGEWHEHSFEYTEVSGSGCWDCSAGTGSLASTGNWIQHNYIENSFSGSNLALAGDQGVKSAESWDTEPYADCTAPDYGVGLAVYPHPETNIVTTDLSVYGPIIYVEMAGGALIFHRYGMPALAYSQGLTAECPASKVAFEDPVYVATQPVQGLIVASDEPVAYV